MIMETSNDGHNKNKLVIIESFYGGSHKQLVDLLFHKFDAVKFVLPAKKWHWRARTSALYFSQTIPQSEDYQVLFTSSVLNLAELVALRPDLGGLKKILYFHENQLMYPVRKQQERDFQYGYNQVLSCLVTDTVLFNSTYNLESFLNNIPSFIKLIPDHRPKGLPDLIRPKCQVLYFPLSFTSLDKNKTKGAESPQFHICEEAKDEETTQFHICEEAKEKKSTQFHICEEAKDEESTQFHICEDMVDSPKDKDEKKNNSVFDVEDEKLNDGKGGSKNLGQFYKSGSLIVSAEKTKVKAKKARHESDVEHIKAGTSERVVGIVERGDNSSCEFSMQSHSEGCVAMDTSDKAVGVMERDLDFEARHSEDSVAMETRDRITDVTERRDTSTCNVRPHSEESVVMDTSKTVGLMERENLHCEVSMQRNSKEVLEDSEAEQPIHIVWAHRWEHDKDPDTFFQTLLRLHDDGERFRLSVMGETYSKEPEIFSKAHSKLKEHIVTWGFQENKGDYSQVLWSADVAVSTAIHEFFGVSMLEAVHCGCYVLCPDRLVYPEIFPAKCLYRTPTQLYRRLRTFCRHPHLARNNRPKVNSL